MRDVTSAVGGLWDLRIALGTHTPLGVELGYTGTASQVETFTGADNGTLVGSTVEAAVRLTVLPRAAWTPYVFAGIGWQHYDLVDASFATADTGMSDGDDVLDVPAGAGLAYRHPSGLLVDVRGTFRVAAFSDLLIEPDGDDAPLHSWQASAAIGYEL